MKIRNSERKLNNKGFSLMELIVVVAIMIVMVGAAAVTVSMLDSSYVEDAERGIKDYIALGRTKSMSVSAKDWYMSVAKDGSDYYACLYKVVEEPISDDPDAGVEDKVYIVEKKKLGNKLTIEFGTTDDNKIDITSTNELQLHFDAATGKIKEVKVGPTTFSTTSGIGNIYITRNDYDIKLKVFFNTGKCERE